MAAQTPIRRRRTCGPKTRTGCFTCKIRRVKCDEAKPACRRCASTGRKCDGYAQDVTISSPDSGGSPDTLALIQQITTRVQGSAQEKRGFHYFLTETAPELSGFYTTGFWEYLILQTSAVEPSLRHSVIAIGALHEEFSQKRLEQLPGNESQGIAFAMSQYTKAIGHLRRSLATGKQKPLTALMSCILFVCFDCLRGYFESAMVHLQSGLRILRDMTRTKDVDHIIETVISPLFLRLSVQSIMYIDTRRTEDRKSFARELTHVCHRKGGMPKMFESLEEARSCMHEAADGLFRMFYSLDGSKPMFDQTPEAWDMFQKYSTHLDDWNIAYGKFMRAKQHTFTSKQIRGAALLKIHHTCAHIMAACNPGRTDYRAMAEALNCPSTFSRFTAEFQTIINLSRSLITTAEQDARNGKAPLTFSTDLGLIGPLYYTGVKCRVHSIKTAAVELLKRCPRKEGMWDSITAVNLVTQFWELEALHNDLNQNIPGEISAPVPLNEVVDLVFYDGGQWEWKYKTESSMSSPASGVNRVGILGKRPDDSWVHVLEDRSLFQGTFMLSSYGEPSDSESESPASSF
ncbi:Beauvericin cluster-specific repressor BEA4 [Lachnellula suecica]|uniref:Beauvericin cluster-specific repressor BEA4 n=1 Tax=Lachnellula suecica TaxID=602035 RepID=A0A8T9C9W5_9HELO|nr:Beauvericin cluster-specific repressor BEA4 [Lachnellula suecica]